MMGRRKCADPGKRGYSKSAKALPRERKSRSRSPSGKKKGKGRKKSAKSASPKPAKKPVDIMSPDAMTNAYYICHNAVDLLESRGFGWPNAPKKKKGKKGKKKKK
ncbi:small lysine-rich protein 1-like [Ptychodera flava]|uniref:small lysine-rich protein 1-like n=1 Tax=Ptychodera flava TaxID=63121 RepID=UPI00396A344A